MRGTLPWLLQSRAYSTQLIENKAIIKLPEYVKKHVEKLKIKEEKYRLDVQKKVFYRGNTSVPIISCNKKEYNYYLGQIYNEKYPVPLMSRYWMKTKSVGQKFTINSWDANPSLPKKIELTPVSTELLPEDSMSHFISEFSQMDLSTEVLDGLKALNFHYPTPIQAMTVPKILKHHHTLCVAETGSGKTMSYAIPIINNLLSWKGKIKQYRRSPLALIVVPGRELAEQIALNTHKLCACCGLNVTILIPGGTKYPFLRPNDSAPLDILVASFGTIHKLVYSRTYNLAQLHHLVLDEADTLLDDSFKQDFTHFMSRIMVQETSEDKEQKPPGAQLILSSTTMPRNVESVLHDCLFEGEGYYEKSVSPYMHKVLPHIPQKFIRVDRENRAAVLLELVKADVLKKKPVMVFCNQSPACNWMAHFFDENDIRNVKFHAGMSFQERAEALEKFLLGEVDVMCCTDLASRGLDTQVVKHVINFDFPNNVSDYILRVGRVGRVGTNQGHVTSLVARKSGVHVLQNIEMAVRKSTKINHVDANIKKKIERLYRYQ